MQIKQAMQRVKSVKMLDPNDFIIKIWKKIKQEWKIAFISAFIIGIITHLFIMVNVIPNRDAINNIYATQNVTHLGRWFLQYVCKLTSYYTLPWIIGLVSILLISITSCVIVELFKIKKKLSIILVSAILVTFPTIASTFSYIYTIDGYMWALLFAALSVLLAYKYKYGFIAGAILICFSLGIYQAYVSVAILLCIFKILFSILDGEGTKKVGIQLFKYIVMGILGVILYYIAMKFMLFIQNTKLNSYQGVEKLNNLNIITMLNGLPMVFKDFFSFIKNASFYRSNIIIILANIAIVLLSLVLFIKEYINKKVIKNPINNIISILLILSIPVACNIVYCISYTTNFHLLMRYSYCLFYIVALVLMERQQIKLCEWITTLSLICIIFNFIIVSNIGYINLYYCFEKSYSLAERISKSILENEEYNSDMPVAIIGLIDNKYYPGINPTSQITLPLTGLSGNTILFDQIHYASLFSNYFNINIKQAKTTDIQAIKQTDEFKNMENYPSSGSVKVINNILVVKLSE